MPITPSFGVSGGALPRLGCPPVNWLCRSVHAAPEQLYKTLAFYKFHPILEKDLEAFRQQLLSDLAQWNIVGRIYISTEGINAQLSCPEQHITKLKAYCEQKLKPKLGNDLMDLNMSTEEAGRKAFRALHVRIRKQLVADGLDPKSYDLANQPSHLSPAEWHEKLVQYKQKHGKDPILIDMRNHYESKVGYFEGAIRPPVDTFREGIVAMNEIVKSVPRDQEIFMYCTGGIRCSKAGAILQSASGFKKVHLVAGGVTAYGQWLQKEGMRERSIFRGKNFTFDKRMGEPITDDVFGQCHICGEKCNRYQNCSHSSCNLLMLCCDKCAAQFLNTCGRMHCYDTVHNFRSKTDAFFKPDGPVMIDGVRAYVKKGQDAGLEGNTVVIGKKGVQCEHGMSRRVRAEEVLGAPGDVLKTWTEAGRELPPIPSTSSSP